MPRWATRRRPERRTTGARKARIAQLLGMPFMPWQAMVADVAGELLEDGSPAYKTVIVTVPRQSGKTTLELAEANDTAVETDGARMAFTMQTGFEAHKKLVNDWKPIMERSRLMPLVDRFRCSTANTALEWNNGSRLDVVATSPSAGHGLTLDKVFMDEVWAHPDDSMEQALIPTMATRPHAQLWILSTAGTAHSPWFRRKVEQGRSAAEADTGTGIAYFEWSAPDDADPYDEQVWWACMPALGHTQSIESLRATAETLSEDSWRRAFLNQWVQGDGGVIPAAMWEQVESVNAAADASGVVSLALDVHDRHYAIAVSDGRTVEIVEHGIGLDGVAARCDELRERYGVKVLVDQSGPAAGLASSTASVEPVKTAGAAAMRFYEAVMDNRVRVRAHSALSAAVEGAVKRDQGDRWAWSRKGSLVDISTLVAASLAFGGGSGPSTDPDTSPVLVL